MSDNQQLGCRTIYRAFMRIYETCPTLALLCVAYSLNSSTDEAASLIRRSDLFLDRFGWFYSESGMDKETKDKFERTLHQALLFCRFIWHKVDAEETDDATEMRTLF